MPITFTTARRVPATAHVVAHGVTTEGFEDGSGLPDGVEAGAAGRLGFDARAEQVLVLPSGERLVALVGLGSADEVSTDTVRRSAAALARATCKIGRAHV